MSKSTSRFLAAIILPIAAIAVAAIACTVQKVPQPGVSSLADERTALIKADSDFMADTHSKGVAGWTSWFTNDGRQVSSKHVIIGHDSITAAMASTFASADDRLDWGADYANVSADGTLGYTYGHWSAMHRDAPGAEMKEAATGRYLTIWRRQGDGSWKVELDTGVR